ncbi:MAG TPA: hypothetical protein PLY13_06550, partial [Methanoregulaceae archaeon]|nr:hypothetical protein [Methanoregulaceae archaeon]
MPQGTKPQNPWGSGVRSPFFPVIVGTSGNSGDFSPDTKGQGRKKGRPGYHSGLLPYPNWKHQKIQGFLPRIQGQERENGQVCYSFRSSSQSELDASGNSGDLSPDTR